ncbi:MAG: YlxR family protein [Chloroflexi bacterium]|nr:YlxR family protein [Chloroflexota bacterium]
MAAKQRREKHVPQRTCIVCRSKADKRQLRRLVKAPAGAPEGVVLDPSGRLPGRGAYLCEKRACWERALQSGVLERALRTTLTPEARAALLEHGSQADE